METYVELGRAIPVTGTFDVVVVGGGLRVSPQPWRVRGAVRRLLLLSVFRISVGPLPRRSWRTSMVSGTRWNRIQCRRSKGFRLR